MVKRTVDLRSDTVTKPTEAMRNAMANAEVDDDVLGYDPTAQRLEAEMARITGKEAGLFVPSGTMGNLISVLTHCQIRGSEIILGDYSHIHFYENGGISTLGGVHPRTVKNNEDGTMDLDQIEAVIRDPSFEIFFPTTRLICLENSHAHSGGRCLSAEYTDKVGELAKKYGLKLHIDGARIFNASVALGVPVHRLVQAADSVSICLSKGLGAPVGSVIVGSKSFIARAKILRKTLGGGMRQIGILCAAALTALQENLVKLEGDHRNAKILAAELNKIKGLKVDVDTVETNILICVAEIRTIQSDELLTRLLLNTEFLQEAVSMPLAEMQGILRYTEGVKDQRNRVDQDFGKIRFTCIPRRPTEVQSTIVLEDLIVYSPLVDLFLETTSPPDLHSLYQSRDLARLRNVSTSFYRIRFVIHHQISENDVHYAVSCLQRVLAGVAEENGDKLTG